MNEQDAEWRTSFHAELDQARAARSRGNEGMARVCARRAAGVVVRAYYAEKNKLLPGSSVLNHLRVLQSAVDESEVVREVARHFALRITPDHELPEDVDLIADVMWLEKTLFPENVSS